MSRPRKVTDDEILSAAAQIFEEGGLNASTEKIANAIGISQPALFKRFGTKKALSFRAVLHSLNQNLECYLSEISYDERPFDIQLIEMCERAIAFLHTQMPKIRLMQGLGVDLLRRAVPHDDIPPIRHHRHMTAWFQAAIDSNHIEHDSASGLAAQFLGAMIAHIHLSEFGEAQHKTAKDYAVVVANTLLHGISPRKEATQCL